MKKLMVRVVYPNGMTASWAYDLNDQLLQVCNATPTNVISQYDYIYDAAGRRVQIARSGSAMSENRTDVYGYNEKDELISAVKQGVIPETEYAYEYDDIGNRLFSFDLGTNRTYTANNLNQYTAVDDFIPQFDDDGNQTLVKTATGVWQVTYNGENRPIHWSNGSTNIVMSFDRMGRRVMKNDLRFVYDGYLQIANFEVASTNSQLTTHNAQLFIWDPTALVMTRPLVWNRGIFAAYYTHDGNKNVSEVVVSSGGISAHYEYAPYGAVLSMLGENAQSNPWRLSSEYAEDDSATVYYNFRHYEPDSGRWLSRDPIEEDGGMINIYSYLGNTFGRYFDCLGQFPILPILHEALKSAILETLKVTAISLLTSWYDIILDNGALVRDVIMSDCGKGGFKQNDDEGFHQIKLYSPRNSSIVNKSLRKGISSGSAAFLSRFAAGSLSAIIRNHADEFLTAKPGSLYYKYYKKIEKLITKEGAKELSDEMVDKISELAVSEIGNVSSLINGLNVVPDEVQNIKWTVEDNCRICAIIKESFTIDITIMGEKESIKDDGPEGKLRCFDYEELGAHGIVGREARKACSICPCKKK